MTQEPEPRGKGRRGNEAALRGPEAEGPTGPRVICLKEWPL